MLKQTLEDLCAFGHRLTTTANERKAAEYLSACLEKLGYETTLEEFPSPRTFSWTYFVLYLGFAVSIPMVIYLPEVSLVLFLLTLILFLGEQTTLFSPLTEIVFARGRSQNVMGQPPGQKAQGTKRLWLVAHYDSSKTSLAFSPASVPLLRPLFFFSLLLLAMAFFILLVGFRADWIQRLPLKVWLFFSGTYFFYMAMMMLERELRGVPVMGAADNASGAAVVMELAKRLAQKPPANIDYRVLFTGAEEVEMVGMGHFLKKHKRELALDKDYFLNFDSLGEGRLCWITKEGMIRPLAGSAELIGMASDLAQEEKFRAITGCPFTALTLDTLVPRARGFQVLSFMALTEKNFPKPWHWFDDTLERLDLNKLLLAVDFAEQLVRKFDRSAA